MVHNVYTTQMKLSAEDTRLGKITAKTGTTIAYKNGLKVMEISAQAAFFSTNVKY